MAAFLDNCNLHFASSIIVHVSNVAWNTTVLGEDLAISSNHDGDTVFWKELGSFKIFVGQNHHTSLGWPSS